MLQEKFEKFLKGTLNLDDKYFNFIVSRGWGLAGVREENSIITTKIPKSGYITDYMEEKDPEKKSQHFMRSNSLHEMKKTHTLLLKTFIDRLSVEM